MSWLNKFFDLFLGEKEEEHEREPNTHAQIPKQQSLVLLRSLIAVRNDREAEIPFRIFVIYFRIRRQPSRDYAAGKEQTERKQHTHKEPDTVKKPFKPSSIPSPVYGFQSQHSIKKAPISEKGREENVSRML
jgi:S-DNA-T family DNA segregation ATPase FtsK/SpoIIIE